MTGKESKGQSKTKDYTGVGPKGHRSMDDRIRWEIGEALAADPTIDPSDMEVLVQNAEVTLNGEVEDLIMMRSSEDIIQTIPNVKGIHNHLQVRKEEEKTA
jgi:osmotically-inducible protein OsmY